MTNSHKEMLISMVEAKIDSVDFQIDSSDLEDDFSILLARKEEFVSLLDSVKSL